MERFRQKTQRGCEMSGFLFFIVFIACCSSPVDKLGEKKNSSTPKSTGVIVSKPVAKRITLADASLHRPACSADSKGNGNMSYIEKLVNEYHEGNMYTRHADLLPILTSDGRPDCFAVNQISHILPKEDAHTSEQLVRLLVDISIKTDPFDKMTRDKYNQEAPLVRDEGVIGVLVSQALKHTHISKTAANRF
jgi:hypothetical protein